MNKCGICFAAVLVVGALLGHACMAAAPLAGGEKVALAAPALKGTLSVEEAIAARRSVRSLSEEPLTMEQVSQLLWAAQGITQKERGLRAAPSARAIYPLTVYAVMKDAAYRYVPAEHALEKVKDGDLRAQLSGQQTVTTAPLTLVIAADYAKMSGAAAHTWADFEAGCAAENVFLQAVAMGLGSVPVGGMEPAKVAETLGCPAGETVIILIPVGKPAA